MLDPAAKSTRTTNINNRGTPDLESDLFPSRKRPFVPLREVVPEKEMEYIASQINEALRGRKIETFHEIEIDGRELHYSSSNKVTQIGSYVFVIAGQPEEFLEKGDRFLRRRLGHLQRRLNVYLEAYKDNVFLVPASHTVPDQHRPYYPLSPHTALMAAQIAVIRDNLPGLHGADLACGDGILAQLLLAEGLEKVSLLDYNEDLLNMADLLLNRWRGAASARHREDSPKGPVISIESQDLWSLNSWRENGENLDLVTLNLGPFYNDDQPLHDQVLNELAEWPNLKVLLSGGYQVTEPSHQEACQNAVQILSLAGYSVNLITYRSLALLAATRH
jgi:2-polyprenyl-3-methyl-5-hydroxy-6-metoxy-1,4-benzoquinol methylase